jgi:hypothetical protein
MRSTFILVALFFSTSVFAQQNFPNGWKGSWKGDLLWHKKGQKLPEKVNMELRILPADSGKWNWQIIYGKETEDNRPYLLVKKDTAGVHWAIDEKNGIVLDQYWVGNKLSGAFTVSNNTIINNYWMEKGKLMVEFYSISSTPISTTGNGTDESPKVDNYEVKSYQKAILTKVK